MRGKEIIGAYQNKKYMLKAESFSRLHHENTKTLHQNSELHHDVFFVAVLLQAHL